MPESEELWTAGTGGFVGGFASVLRSAPVLCHRIRRRRRVR